MFCTRQLSSECHTAWTRLDFYEVAHSLSSVHSLSLAAANLNEQVSRQWLHHEQVIDQQLRLLLAVHA